MYMPAKAISGATMSMQDQRPYAETMEQIRRLDQRADHLEYQGQNAEAAELRQAATALTGAEAQRVAALADAYQQAARLTERVRITWEMIEPGDSFAWFIEHSDDQDVIELRDELRREQTRILILEAAKA